VYDLDLGAGCEPLLKILRNHERSRIVALGFDSGVDFGKVGFFAVQDG
jgi:hypothetical protein